MDAELRILLPEPDACTGCGACTASCNRGALQMCRDTDGFWVPRQSELCTACGNCVLACPILNEPQRRVPEKIYAGYAVDELCRKTGSSGGIFPILAQAVLQQGGVVYGAAVDAGGDVRHSAASKQEELIPLAGSKYAPSWIDTEVFTQIQCLVEDVPVLFVGTPCQVAGLRSFLGKEVLNLYTVDLFCYGTPTPSLFEKYKQHLQRKGALQSFTFRLKIEHHPKVNFLSYTIDGKVYTERFSENSYTYLFFTKLFLRRACYRCRHKNLFRCGDISLGDLWVKEGAFSSYDDGGGASTIFINSPRGGELWQECVNDVVCRPMEAEELNQPSLSGGWPHPPGRGDALWVLNRFGYACAYVYIKCVDRISKLAQRVEKKIFSKTTGAQ